MRTAATLIVALVLLAGSAHGSAAAVRGPFLLVALPALGTVTWRCEQGTERYALGFRANRASSTAVLRLSTGAGTVRRATVDPGETLRLPYARGTQRLAFVQQTGAGTLRATVTARFGEESAAAYCYAYLPPPVTVGVGPRR
ncbi:MAG: hypothetical protein M3540_05190 [Actinomycetota bacterium]|nr:hypothetical protein [Actinomycetota bacterium]